MNHILKDLRIIEGSAFVAAPLAGMTLAQLGADVIRFDPIRDGLDAKRWPVDQHGKSLYWVGLNKGKRSTAVELINVTVGQSVAVGDKIATIEAMKMKTEVFAKGAGKVMRSQSSPAIRSTPAASCSRSPEGADPMTIPDTVYGALLLSVIDFFLSMVMISGIGVVLGLFPLLNRLGKVDEAALRQSDH